MLRKYFLGFTTACVLLVGCTEEVFDPLEAENSINLMSSRSSEKGPKKSKLDNASGCTRTIGFWKNHPDDLSSLLPVWLGNEDGDESIFISDIEGAEDKLKFDASNGIQKLYAQLLAAKLNILAGAPGSPVEDVISDVDNYLGDTGWDDWNNLSKDEQQLVLDWKTELDDYNNGLTDVPHCDSAQNNDYAEENEGVEEETTDDTNNGGVYGEDDEVSV